MIIGFLVAFAILFSAIDAQSIQLTMFYKLKKSTSDYLSPLLVAYMKVSVYMKSGNKRVLLELIACNLTVLYLGRSSQARRQDSVTGGGAKNKFLGGTRSLFLWIRERHGGKRNLSQSGSGQNREFKRFFRPKTGDLQKKNNNDK